MLWKNRSFARLIGNVTTLVSSKFWKHRVTEIINSPSSLSSYWFKPSTSLLSVEAAAEAMLLVCSVVQNHDNAIVSVFSTLANVGIGRGS